jgi:hypothetical protein
MRVEGVTFTSVNVGGTWESERERPVRRLGAMGLRELCALLTEDDGTEDVGCHVPVWKHASELLSSVSIVTRLCRDSGLLFAAQCPLETNWSQPNFLYKCYRRFLLRQAKMTSSECYEYMELHLHSL